MDTRVISPLIDMMPLAGCSRRTGSKACIYQIEDLLVQVAGELGFENMRFTRWIKKGSNRQSDSYSVNFNNFPPEWTALYDSKHLYKIDPVIRFTSDPRYEQFSPFGSWASAHQRARKYPIGRSNVERRRYTDSVDALFENCAEFGLNSGVYMVYGDGHQQMQLSLATVRPPYLVENELDPGFWKTLKTIIVLFDELIRGTEHCSDCSMGVRKLGKNPISLSSSQRRILQLFIDNTDGTIDSISKLHGSSINNINYHLKKIRLRLEQPGVSGQVLAHYAREHNLI